VLTHAEVTARLRAAGCVFAEDEATLLCDAPADRRAELHERRVAGEPLEHVLGWELFCQRRITVGPGVFVPRRRTEFLARQAIALCHPGAVVLDLCCGSGAIGAVVAAARPTARVHAADVDPAALACARRNLPAGSGVHQGDLYQALPGSLRGRVDVLTANVPYVPTGEIPLLPAEARLHEPPFTLDGGADGLGMLRRVAAGAAGWLAPGGHLLSETSAAQATTATAVLAGAGLDARIVKCEQLEATVVIGSRRPAHWEGASP
jgi:release factor glutamine methyltransferase